MLGAHYMAFGHYRNCFENGAYVLDFAFKRREVHIQESVAVINNDKAFGLHLPAISDVSVYCAAGESRSLWREGET